MGACGARLQRPTEGPYEGKRKLKDEGAVTEEKGGVKRDRKYGKGIRGESSKSLVEAVRQSY